MIIRARVVVTMEGAPLENGAVAVNGNEITDAGPWREVRARNSGETLDLGERVLLPGLINAHCHLDYTDRRGAILPQRSFTDWIRAINERKASWSGQDYVRSIRNGFEELRRFGTTGVANYEAFPGLIAKTPAPVRTWWLWEMIDVRSPVSAADFHEGQAGLAPHAPYTASRKLYAEAAAIEGAILSTHLAESREEMQMFRDAAGPLFEFMRSIGRKMDDCGSKTPLANWLGHIPRPDRWLVVHLNELSEDDFALLENGPRFSIAHCPRSHAWFGHAEFQLRRLRDLGFNICLGTDSLASNSNLSLFEEMRALWKNEPSLTARELLEMVTVNPARALGRESRLGVLRPGGVADLLALPCAGCMENLFAEIVSFEGAAPWLMIDGVPSY